MKSLKSSWKVWTGAAVGFVLGVLAFHAPVKAQTGTDVTIQKIVSIWDWHQGTSKTDLTHLRSTLHADGSQIVGFSCVLRDAKSEAECYVASVGR
jgi:hypothetical protein